ncbi:hypothetical protein cypCar_00043716, partial [Cyprinus carpio]
ASPSVTTQPLPFGLEREKHIDMLFRAFHRQIRPTTDTQDLTPALQDTGRTRGEDGGPAWKETVNDSKRLGKLSALKTVTRLNIAARPELQGPQCVARRTYSISTETRDRLFVAVEDDYTIICIVKATKTCSLKWSMFTPYFEICDSEGISAVRIQGSCCNTRCLSEQELQQVVSSIGEIIGCIWKRWPGYNEECNMDHEYFGLDVPQGMNLNTKVLLLAAAFLLNHMFFEMS